MITKEELLEKLKPYFDAGIITDTLYVSNDMCVFNYGDMCYIGFPCLLHYGYPLGMVIPTQHVESNLNNPLLFFEQYKIQLDENLGHMCHFSEKNLQFYFDNMEKIRKTQTSKIDSELSERLKSQYMGRTK